MSRTSNPLFTREMRRDEYVHPAAEGLIYRSKAEEQRASDTWISTLGISPDLLFAIVGETDEAFSFVDPLSGELTWVRFHEPEEILAFLCLLPADFRIDITGLGHRTWAPVVKMAIEHGRAPVVIYVEPGSYRSVLAPDLGEIFDLSQKSEGVAPLPGFARLEIDDPSPSKFVPMLGFEGPRFERLLSSLELDLNRVYPIIGVPGFRPAFAHYAYKGNRNALERYGIAHQIRFVKANCPFDMFYLLDEIQHWDGDSRLRVAPIGTKPHGLGAVLFAISRGSSVEVIYDHPIKSERRTSGEARLCLYDLASFCKLPIFLAGL